MISRRYSVKYLTKELSRFQYGFKIPFLPALGLSLTALTLRIVTYARFRPSPRPPPCCRFKTADHEALIDSTTRCFTASCPLVIVPEPKYPFRFILLTPSSFLIQCRAHLIIQSGAVGIHCCLSDHQLSKIVC